MRPGCWITFLVAALFFSACARLAVKAPGKPADLETRALIRSLKNKNNDLKTFKGIGKIKLWNEGKIRFSERIAWVGKVPLKFRFELLFSGQSLTKIASDGQWLYYRNRHSDRHPYGRVRLTDSNLERLLSIPIKPADFMALLSGRIPVYGHDLASLEKNSAGEGYVLKLENRWQRVVERIYLDRSKMSVQQIEIFNHSGALIYRVVFDKIIIAGKYQIPGRLVVSSDTGSRFQLDIQNYQTDVAVKPSMFFLEPPR
jgi:hypothetical protein